MFEGVEYSPQMQCVFVDILNEVCLKESNRNWEAFSKISEKYHIENKDITVQKSVAAIQNRIRRYFIGTLKDIFAKKTGLNVKELFNYKVLLDLSSIIRLGGEKENQFVYIYPQLVPYPKYISFLRNLDRRVYLLKDIFLRVP